MRYYLLVRFAKLVALLVLVLATAGATLSRDVADRRRWAYRVVGPAFGLVWTCGYLLSLERSASLLSAWILGAMALSLFSLQVCLFAAGRPHRRGAAIAAVALVPLVLCVALMVFRPAL